MENNKKIIRGVNMEERFCLKKGEKVNGTIVKVFLFDDSEDVLNFGTIYALTDNEFFISEIQKYKCSDRVIQFLEEQKGVSFSEIYNIPEHFDILVDLRENFSKKAWDFSIPLDIKINSKAFIASTPHLDMYGA
jgi:hypothetical protein